MIGWAEDILYDLWVEESGSDQGNELLRSWKVKGNLVWDRVWGPGRGGGSLLRSKRGKEEKRKRPSTEHRRGKMGSKATSKLGGGAFLRSRKGNGFLSELEGKRVQASKEEEERWRIGKRKQRAAPLISFAKGGARWWLDDKNREQIFLSRSCTRTKKGEFCSRAPFAIDSCAQILSCATAAFANRSLCPDQCSAER